jgi:hypothetical protein
MIFNQAGCVPADRCGMKARWRSAQGRRLHNNAPSGRASRRDDCMRELQERRPCAAAMLRRTTKRGVFSNLSVLLFTTSRSSAGSRRKTLCPSLAGELGVLVRPTPCSIRSMNGLLQRWRSSLPTSPRRTECQSIRTFSCVLENFFWTPETRSPTILGSQKSTKLP